MNYRVVDCRYQHDREIEAYFATNDKQEAIAVADEIGGGTTVIRIDEEISPEIIYVAGHKTDLGIKQ